MQKNYKIIHIITRLDKEVQQKIHSFLFWEQIRKKMGLAGKDVAMIFNEEGAAFVNAQFSDLNRVLRGVSE